MELLLNGDCLEKLKRVLPNSIDSIVTDPPYGLSFMGKKWDYDVPSTDIWKECLRVLKPGGHLLSFGGTRTYHRMAVNIEDAGFEIRDQIQWLYGSGFPKSHNLKDEWHGWGSALKPANEPICMARKLLEKGLTIAENVSKWGTGAINIDESRIEASKDYGRSAANSKGTINAHDGFEGKSFKIKERSADYASSLGRWPANVIFDEQGAELLGEPSRFFYVAKASKSERNAGLEVMPLIESGIKNDSGRGFIESDPHKIILNQNHHPTVKPIKLMQYLIKLITPPQGIVLDPFMGSGSTGVAAKRLGFNFIGCELNNDYFEIAKKRIENG